jgi:hypothetical protein
MKKILLLFTLMVFANQVNGQFIINGYKQADISSGGSSVVSAYTCNTASAGTMKAGEEVLGVTHTITATVTKKGTYKIEAVGNGIVFKGSGTFSTVGNQTIVLTATGTPITAGTTIFTLNTTPNCNFTRDIISLSSNGTAIIDSYTCDTDATGIMVVGTAVSGISQTITADVTALGSYAISTTANGITFTGSGTFATTGSQDIVLTATGTPTTAGTTTFTLNTTPDCNFSRNIISPSSNGTAIVDSYTCDTQATGIMKVGTAVSGISQTITANVNAIGTYAISTTANGVTFAGSGTFTAIGSQDIVLTATGTPITIGTNTFTLNTTPGCNFSRTTIDASSGGSAVVSAYSCSTASTGSIAAGIAVSSVTQTITATVTAAGTYNISTIANGVTFAGSGTFTAIGSQNIVLTATGTPTAAGINSFTLNTTPGCSFNRITANNPSSNGTATVSDYSCATASLGTMTTGTVVASVTQTISANVATAGTYNISATANGVTFAGSGTFAGTGAQTIVLRATGTPTAAGTNSFTLNTTPGCSFDRTTIAPSVPNLCNPANPTAIVNVTSATGKVWMDRNLGANRAAISSNDPESYGSLFQWGRGADGHQCVNRYSGDGVTTSGTTTTLSSVDVPGNANFIINGSSTSNYDWRLPTNSNLWGGISAKNNPCPNGYRLPLREELEEELNNWNSKNPAGAFASVLKLPMAGRRENNTGNIANEGAVGAYWSGERNYGNSSHILGFSIYYTAVGTGFRAVGQSVRCIKN